jgi:hypothetical protein
MMKGMMKMTKVSSVGRMATGWKAAVCLNSFIVAVTADKIHAIEDKRSWRPAGRRQRDQVLGP